MVFQTSGNGKIIDVVLELMGSETAAQMLPLLHSQDDIAVEGYTSNTSLHRSNRNEIALFVNRRAIQDRDLAWAVEQAYRQSLPQGRHPLAIVLITMPPEQVDVNAHPTKLEVRFRSSNKVFNAVNKAVADALYAHGAIHQVSSSPLSGHQPRNRRGTPPPRPETTSRPNGDAGNGEINGSPYQQRATVEAPAPMRSTAPPSQETPPLNTTPSPGGVENLRDVLPQLTCIGQGQSTYILADGPQGIYILDQHAAHERVIYDRTIRQVDDGFAVSQPLLLPQGVRLNEFQHQSLLENLALVTKHGFDVRQREEHLWTIHTLPRALTVRRSPDAAAALQNLIDEFAAENLLQEASHAMAATVACHSAVRAGDRLTEQEMQAIIDQLADTPEPHHCPHGRPTVITISKHRLEREFRRC